MIPAETNTSAITKRDFGQPGVTNTSPPALAGTAEPCRAAPGLSAVCAVLPASPAARGALFVCCLHQMLSVKCCLLLFICHN